MFQSPDYTILDHLTAICAVVDPDFRYLYVNRAAAKHEKMSREEMLGRTIVELRASNETDLMISHLEECLRSQKPVEFVDQMSKWKIRMEPVPEGAFIHWIQFSAPKTKVRVRGSKKMAPITVNNGYLQRSVELEMLEIDGWLESLDLRTKESNEHILRVADTTVVLAKMAGIPESEIIYIRYGAMLHDIGKIGIPDRIWLKPDPLTDEEWELVRKHPVYAYDLFHSVEYLRYYLPIPYSHHERWDGRGYPHGLTGEQIPLAARLFAVIDVWDSLSCDRSYRKAWPNEKILDYIQDQSGTQFDPQAVDLFFRAKDDLTRLGLW